MSLALGPAGPAAARWLRGQPYAVCGAGTTGVPADGYGAAARRAGRASGVVPPMDVRSVRAAVAVVPVVVSIVTPVVVFVTVVSVVPPTRGAVVGEGRGALQTIGRDSQRATSTSC